MDFRTRASTVKDPLVRRAIDRFERDLGRRWTVEDIARELGTSRPVLARRFVSEFGRPPLRVLRSLRMERAAHLLRTTEDALVSIADEVGYDSEFALSRAFFRHYGVRPGRYRNESLTAPIAGVSDTFMMAA